MSSSTFHYLLGLLEPLLDCRDPPRSPLPLSPHSRLAAGLLRLASGAPYDHISRLLGVPADAARFCARRLCRVLCTNFRFWLAFPASDADLDSVSVGFLPSLPNCCGAIVCARFEVGGGCAIAAQVVADASSRILGVATGFRGDRDDSEVLRSSSLYKRRVSAPRYLVGGGSYPLLPWLMVPFVDPRAGSSEEDFNAVHRSMCEPALRTVASLRNWGVLSRPIEEDAKMAAAFVGACSILHNVLLMREDYSALSEVGIMEDRLLNDRESGCLLEAFSEEALAIRRELTVKAKEIRGS
ncbi:hypothetical protein QJS04_geneDACA006392 [Acorus gramineus]|uniref:DDE Tnp4 domain-containing protein n=1 Tax=Acorus gramineus TaxID=55184 RepID=A0AAV9AUI2_ACOGR|nr:hypothetical protein QJS04_geneDACA006392 [Acorus gramineus]